MVLAARNPRAYSLLTQLQRQCYLSRQLLFACRCASTQTQPKAQTKATPSISPQARNQASPEDNVKADSSDDSPLPSAEDKKFVPIPLNKPLGITRPPESGENTGTDERTRGQRRADIFDYDKHVARRKLLMKQAGRPYYRDWKNLRNAKGKLWIAPERLFRADRALYFPNLVGKTLEMAHDDQNTTDQFADSISLVSLYSGQWASNQAETFVKGNKELDRMLQDGRAGKTPFQKVDINIEQNVMRSWLLRMFMGSLRKKIPPEDHENYFMIKKGFTDDLMETVGILNKTVGYTYLVDQECRIRWAASAEAHPEEITSLNRAAPRLIQEYRETLGDEHWQANGFDVKWPRG